MGKPASVDQYIKRAPAFAQPILRHLRRLVHQAAPGIEETIKWQMPFFMAHGRNVCGMAAFNAHCAFVIVGGKRVFGAKRPSPAGGKKAMGQFGRITRRADLPSDRVLIGYLRKCVALNRAAAR
jgi:hypothetical protein